MQNTEIENTKKSYQIVAKNIIITINKAVYENIDNIINYLTKKEYNYLLMCEHDGPSEKHIHLYVQYQKPRKLTTKFLYGSHIEQSKGNAQQNIRYLKAEDEKHKELNVKSTILREEGEPTDKRKVCTIKDIKQMTDDEIDNLKPNLYKIAKEIKKDDNAKYSIIQWAKLNKKIKVKYCYGLGGSGKTYYCFKWVNKHFDVNNFQIITISYDERGFANIIGDSSKPQNIKAIIINEFRDNNMKFKTFLELLTNENVIRILYNTFYCPNLEYVLINSIQKPNRIYKEITEDKNQIKRRITKIKYFYIDENKEYKHINQTWEEMEQNEPYLGD